MSNEELIEEILHESYILGIYSQVMELASSIKETRQIDAFQIAFNELKPKEEK